MNDNKKFISAELVLSPEGHLYLAKIPEAESHLSLIEFEQIETLFSENASKGLLHLGIRDFTSLLPASFIFWQSFARLFVTQVCKLTSTANTNQELPIIPTPEPAALQEIINQAFLIRGIEYLHPGVLVNLWQNLVDRLREELSTFPDNVQKYFNHYNPRWNLVGRICFHLAENKNNEQRPFAFLATYSTQLSKQANAQHLPLKRALQDYAGENNNTALLNLLLPIQKAANESPFIKSLVDSGAIFQPQLWTAYEAHQFLQQVAIMESSGIIVRIPNWWNTQKPPRPKVVVNIGEHSKGMLGLDSLLDFDIHLALDSGEKITQAEWQALLNSSENLIKIKGQWVEVDRKKLEAVLSQWNKLKDNSATGLSMAEGLRLLAGARSEILDDPNGVKTEDRIEWSSVQSGNWLKAILEQLRSPENPQEKQVQQIVKKHLHATLRPYQLKGVSWLWLLYQLKLGGCLADDMGLGKTIQILSLLLIIQHHQSTPTHPKKKHLLIVPASLLGNWQIEAARFAPSLKMYVAHSSLSNKKSSSSADSIQLADADIVLTTYAFAHRLTWLKEAEWNLIILDEAQLIKNTAAKQTQAVKSLKGSVRLALTGTPVENRLGDLWSLFDFTSPGLLGTAKVFSSYAKKAGDNKRSKEYQHFMGSLRNLTQPYILRRLKSDRSIITDLPDKTEMQTYCSLSKEQIQLYQQSLEEFSNQLQGTEGIQRRGLVLSYLLRFKQICNHPTQWLGYGDYTEDASGKFIRLKEICEEIAAKQEKVLIFTQFREVIEPIAAFLTKIFAREGLILHGDTPIKQRSALVESFQQELGPPFFVLSLKAGGTGLTLTRASHVIHFDRWWNPAVENQATDRAYRIGQKHPVMVHKFICRGTIEEKIDALIASKKNLSQDILDGGGEVSWTEMTNDELLGMISLDIHRALGEY